MNDGLIPGGTAATDSAGGLFGDIAPPPQAYRVLARKYRPSTFADLIGQEAMVRTLSNAFDTGRVHQAYVLTGVRGVGKTTTARILARAFNYEIPGEVDRPTIHMPVEGVHCRAIIESRHMDVIEMDAASHTGIDDVREIIDGSRYRPVSARTKVYIIDEVHMLSKQAFNGLLKTLEEPPEHVKFVFATTEIEKVPVTVRSRCLRFDLRRIEANVMVAHLAGICAKEGVAVDEAALALIARAAEGSVRDALSLLDQAIAHGAEGSGGIEAGAVRAMLGLADRAQVVDLFELVMRGDIAAALALLRSQHDQGADPAHVLSELAEMVHFVTRLKLAPETAKDPAVTQEERERGQKFADALPIRVLTRAWQILLKGLQDLKDTSRPLAAADMVLVRLAYAADLPTPDEAIRSLQRGGAEGQAAASPAGPPPGGPPATVSARPALQSVTALQVARAAPVPVALPAADPEPHVRLTSIAEAIALAEMKRDIQLKTALERDVRLVRFEPGRIEFSLAPGGSPQLAATLARRLQEWTGIRWMAAISSTEGAPSIREQAEARAREHRIGVQADPLVRSVLDRFPGAEIVAVRSNAPAEGAEAAPQPAAAAADEDEDVVYTDDLITEDDL